MEQFDWKIPDKTNKLALKFVGLWPHSDTYKYNFYTFYSIFVTFFFNYLHNILQAINFFYVDDLSVATAIIFVALTDLVSILKFHVVYRNMQIVKRLMGTLKTSMFMPKNEKQRAMVMSSVASWRRIFLLFFVLALSTVFFWAIFPILDGGLKEKRLPFFIWYPYDSHKSPFYEITYIHQILSVLYIATTNVNVDSLIAAFMMIVGAQCEILCDDLRNLHFKTNVGEELINCIKHHREILRFAEESNKFYDKVVFAQFFTSTISLGLTMFQLTVVAPFTNEFYSFVIYENAMTLQIFLYCWFGNEVQFKSNIIPYAAYEFDWTDASEEVKKHLVFFMRRTQSPIKPSAFNLFYLSLDTFTSILRTAWSYFALLHSVNTNK